MTGLMHSRPDADQPDLQAGKAVWHIDTHPRHTHFNAKARATGRRIEIVVKLALLLLLASSASSS